MFAVVGLVWLMRATDLVIWRDNWLLLVSLAIFALVLDQKLNFTVLLSTDDVGPSASSSLSPVIIGSMMFLFGPGALWLTVPGLVIDYVLQQRQSTESTLRVSGLRNFIQSIGINIFAPLCGLAVYQALGGTFPIATLEARTVALAAFALGIEFMVFLVVGSAFLWYLVRVFARLSGIGNVRQVVGKLLVFVALGRVMAFFGVLGSVVYVRVGLGSYVFAAMAIIAAAYVANRFTRALTNAAVREMTLKRLDGISRSIMGAPADVERLPTLLQAQAKELFPGSRFEAVLFPDTLLARDPKDDDWPRVPDEIWRKLRDVRAHITQTGLSVPSDRSLRREALVVPVADAENGDIIGGIYLMRNVQRGPIKEMLSAAEVYAEQISSAVLRARSHEQQQAKARAERELIVAGEIQSRFLPKTLPMVPGYQIAAHLNPARQASGDFYDVATLPDGKLSFTIADVADKGTGAALFMALTCTLVRTFAPQYTQQPDVVLREVNRRICEDTETDLFVTVLHGVLTTRTGEFCYCNSGHTPGLLLRANGEWRSSRTEACRWGYSKRRRCTQMLLCCMWATCWCFTPMVLPIRNVPRASYLARRVSNSRIIDSRIKMLTRFNTPFCEPHKRGLKTSHSSTILRSSSSSGSNPLSCKVCRRMGEH